MNWGSGGARSRIVYLSVLVIGLAALLAVDSVSRWQLKTAWEKHLEKDKADLSDKAEVLSQKLDILYQNLRTIALLPSVGGLDRDHIQLSADGKAAIQQIYNNLNINVGVSEVYITPVAFNPDRLDPVTGKIEEPLHVFDELIVDGGTHAKAENPFASKANSTQMIAGSTEVEIEEYRELHGQIAHFATHFPTRDKIRGFDFPVLSSEEVITCDNVIYNETHNDADRKGTLFAVPFYAHSGEMNGIISATIRSDVLNSLIPSEEGLSLIDPSGQSKSGKPLSALRTSEEFVPNIWKTDSNFVYGEVVEIAGHDPRGKWKLRFDEGAGDFYDSDDFKTARSFAFWSFASVLGAIFICLTTIYRSGIRSAALRHRATHDPLTGLANRVLLEERLSKLLAAKDFSKKHTVFYLDLDKFKLVNDTLGHQIGDNVLIEATRRLRSCMTAEDFLARIGGDEFVMVLFDRRTDHHVSQVAQTVIAAMSQHMNVSGHDIVIGVSIGISNIAKDSKTPDEVLRHADLALFRAKAEGRGNFRYYEPAMDKAREERHQLELDLRTAVSRNQLVLHYQPILNLETSKICGYEALVRWNHPMRGMVPPQTFIPLAEEAGLINAIGEWVLKQACIDAKKMPVDTRIAVNLSPLQFRNPLLPFHVISALGISGLSPQRLELEITESVLLANDETSLSTLQQLRDLGVRIALDDFGIGYSSLGYLKTFEFDKVKIDRSFLDDIENEKETVILKAITTLSTSLGMTTVAEGVETELQLDRVRSQGCTEVQGYFFSKPLPLAEALRLETNVKYTA
jgi:diguanylate cyclase (GGDEF)-like protein